MWSNVAGRVNNTHLPKSQALLPLFEAVINSIDAIEDTGTHKKENKIIIRIIRDQISLPIESEGKQIHSPITGFEIEDNGIGFTEDNYLSFNEADSQYKARRGGKGIGRFIWLRAFNKVEVDSTYNESGKIFRRSFTFSLFAKDGISDLQISNDGDAENNRTIVRLIGYKSEYSNNVPLGADTIAKRIVEHCLRFFFLGKAPDIILEDEEEEQDSINLFDIYHQFVSTSGEINFVIDNHKFTLNHFFLHVSSGITHHISFCANDRVVKTESILGSISNLPNAISNDGTEEKYVFAAYISSTYLDNKVDPQRYDFDFAAEAETITFGELKFSTIHERIIIECKGLLKDYIENVRIKKQEVITNYIFTQAPQYRHIIKNHPEKLETILPDISENKLDEALYRIDKQVDEEIREKGTEILEEITLTNEGEIPAQKMDEINKWFEQVNDSGKDELAKYILKRRYILAFLEHALKRVTGRYSLESLIHQVIFPMKKTSDDIQYEKHNLWIIDEKLAYHYYLASDIPFNQIEKLELESQDRPDLIIFDPAFALADEEHPYHSGIVIFEFKRPGRDDYDGNKNPVDQVITYIDDLKSGKLLTKDGRPLDLDDNTPMYCYIVCDLFPKFRQFLKKRQFKPTPDSGGYFLFHTELNAYIEVIGFEKLIGDAKKRNRILFDKLCLPNNINFNFV